MCDTMVVTGENTADGVAIFGKNSDREPNEAQYIAHFPAADHAAGSKVKCTYIEIPQMEHTFAVLLSKPFWIWGAEMGANEHGVVIGNEAVFSKQPAQKAEALLGMDLLRLGLERAESARKAVEVISTLLEQFGQGGKHCHLPPMYYHNSFLIADPKESWILETVDRHWAAQKVNGVASISNGLTLGNQFDLVSKDLESYALSKGWTSKSQDFDFARDYSDFINTRFSRSSQRCRRSQELLKSGEGKSSLLDIISTLRDHGETGESAYRPDGNIFDFTICAHASFGPVRGTQTTGSLVAYMHPEHPLYLLTGTAAPCTSVFKPLWLDAGLPDIGPEPDGSFDAATLFWQHELLHRATLQDYSSRLECYQELRDSMEERFIQQALELSSTGTQAERLAFSSACFSESKTAEKEWLDSILKTKPQSPPNWFYRNGWKKFNHQAKMPI